MIVTANEMEPTKRFGNIWPSNCPYCQAERHEYGTYWFACNSFISPYSKNKDKRSLKCRNGEIKILHRQISFLTERLEAWRTSWWILDAFVHSDEDEDARIIYEKLHQLGELNKR